MKTHKRKWSTPRKRSTWMALLRKTGMGMEVLEVWVTRNIMHPKVDMDR